MRKIIVDPQICNGQPVFEGTRITAQTILDYLAAGDSPEEIVSEYPSLLVEDILEAIRFSSRLLGHHFLIREVA